MSGHRKIAIVIATCNPSDLFERTLTSLSECLIPDNLHRIIIAENGPSATVEELTNSFRDRLPVEYRFFKNAKKCGALNRALDELEDEFIIYLDDDVRLHPGALAAYADAISAQVGRAFYGGNCRVDYEQEPESWLKPHLPAAAIGWAPSEKVVELKTSGPLGFNWGAFAEDVRSVGGYDERCGPGTPANSDEMNVQESLLKNGVRAYYLPEATVWHYVPHERCNPEWLLGYKRKDGIGKGIAISETGWSNIMKQRLGTRAKIVINRMTLAMGEKFLHPHRSFQLKYRVERLQGKLEGIEMGLKEPKPERFFKTRAASPAV